MLGEAYVHATQALAFIYSVWIKLNICTEMINNFITTADSLNSVLKTA